VDKYKARRGRLIAKSLVDDGLVPECRHGDWNLMTNANVQDDRRERRLSGLMRKT